MSKTFLAAAIGLALANPCFTLAACEQKIQWVNCASNVPQLLPPGTVLPNPLPTPLHCGRLVVPMDYSNPISINNNITLGFAMNRPQNPKGLINFNPGGPNGEVASNAWQIALNLSEAAWFAGLEEFDFLAMDVRGTYSSNPLNCSFGDTFFPSSFPSNTAEFEKYQTMIATYAQSCIDLTTPKGLVGHMGSENTVEDWNSLRKALNYETMHFLGWSYGTYGGALYANTYPQHTGRFVLDAVVPHGMSNLDLIAIQTSAVNRLLLRADAGCINDTTCPFHSQGKGSVVQAFRTVLDRAASGNSSNVTGTDVRAMVALRYLNGPFPNFPALNLALHGALNGDWSGLSYAEFGPPFSQGIIGVLSTFCSDLHVDNNTFAGFNAIREQITKVDTEDIQYSLTLPVVLSCGAWPYHGNSDKPLPLDTSLVLVTSDFDLNTPTEATTFAWNQAPNSALVVRHGDGHGTVPVPGPARSAEFDFLITGIMPKPTNQTFVTIYAPGSKRGPIPDPYSVPVGPLAGDIFG